MDWGSFLRSKPFIAAVVALAALAVYAFTGEALLPDSSFMPESDSLG